MKRKIKAKMRRARVPRVVPATNVMMPQTPPAMGSPEWFSKEVNNALSVG